MLTKKKCNFRKTFAETNICQRIEQIYEFLRASQAVLVVKNPATNAGGMRWESSPWVGKISWRREWQTL